MPIVLGGAVVALRAGVPPRRLGRARLGARRTALGRKPDHRDPHQQVGIGEPTLRGSGVAAFGMMSRGIVLVLILIAVAVANPSLALAGALTYAAATASSSPRADLYFQGTPRR